MLNSKLIEVLRQCSTKQLTRLEEFVRSPYFNKNTEVIDFLVQLKKFAPRFSSRQLDRKAVYAALYPDKKYQEKKLGYLMSDLVKLTEQYLSYERFQQLPLKGYFELLRIYNDWGMEKYFSGTMRDAINLQEKQPYRDSDFFFSKYRLEELNSQHFDTQRKRAFDQSLQNAIDNLDLHYLTVKLKYSCEIANRKNVIATDYQLRLLDEILIYLKENPKDHVPAIAIYYRILMTLLDSDDETHFDKLKELLNDHADKFTKPEARDMYAYALNYCVKKINTGHLQYFEEAFGLYKTLLNRRIASAGLYFSHWTYKNIVSTALRLREYAWAEDFIREYKDDLDPALSETVYSYNLALLYFHQQKFGDALSLLQKVEYKDFYQSNVKSLMLKIYYELDETEALYSLLDAFKIFIKRNRKFSDYQKNIYHNLIRFAKKLTKIMPGDKKKARELKQQIMDKKEIADIQWLLEKVDELT